MTLKTRKSSLLDSLT